MRKGVVPRALSTPNSRVRSHTAMSIVFMTVSAAMAKMMKSMMPTQTSWVWMSFAMSGWISCQVRMRGLPCPSAAFARAAGLVPGFGTSRSSWALAFRRGVSTAWAG